MRKIILSLVLVIFAVTLTTTYASAFTLGGYTGPIEFKFTDFAVGSLYGADSDKNGDGIGPDYGMSDGVEDSWGIFKVTTITTSGGGSILWADVLSTGEELTGIYHGLDDDYWDVNAVGGLNIESVGGFIDVYLDATPDYDPSQGGTGPAARVGVTYPTATDGTLFLKLAMVPGIKFGDGFVGNDHITYDNNLDATTSPFTGDGAFYLDVIGGSAAATFDANNVVLTDDSAALHTVDMFGKFSTSTFLSDGVTPVPDGWLVESHDPIGGTAVPEPASLMLLGSGLLGLAAVGRKRRII